MLISRQINWDIQNTANTGLTEYTPTHDCPTDSEARAVRPVPDHSPNNFSKTPTIDILGTNTEPSVSGLSLVTESKAKGALQLEIHPQNDVPWTPWGGQV